MNLENIMLSEIKQTQKEKYCMIPKVPGISKCILTENRIEVTRGWGQEKRGVKCLMGTEFLFGTMKQFWRWTAAHCECT